MRAASMNPSSSDGVAGVKAPAFIERRQPSELAKRSTRVAGVKAPAFIERTGSVVVAAGRVQGLRG